MSDKERGDLIIILGEIKTDVKVMRHDLSNLEKAIDTLQKAYEKEVLPNVNMWNSTANNQSRLVWIVLTAVLVALLGLIKLT